jgi:spore germination protein GerM
MTPRRALATAAFTVVAALVAWLLFVGLPRWYGGPARTTPAPVVASTPAEPARRIKARLFYVGADGTRLATVERDVAYAEQSADQARAIIEAQLLPVDEPLVSAIPAGTKLRALFVTPDGEAFVDLSGDVAFAHPGGSMNELLTVYTIVHALTFNLPAVTKVQVLVEGKEVETLAGHVDLRRPLMKNAAWLEEEPQDAIR